MEIGMRLTEADMNDLSGRIIGVCIFNHRESRESREKKRGVERFIRHGDRNEIDGS